VRTLARHWQEYTIEAVCLGFFLVSAAGFATLLQHPASPLSGWTASPVARRVAMGSAMGLTLIALIYSPLGRRSGAHMNPAVTLTFMRLGKVAPPDAAGYILGQFVGGFAGILAAIGMFRGLPAHPSVNYVATIPGPSGAAVAFAAEVAISFGMMLLTPLSGMSMNPARTLGPAILAHAISTLWIYFTAPLIGMLLAASCTSTLEALRTSGAQKWITHSMFPVFSRAASPSTGRHRYEPL